MPLRTLMRNICFPVIQIIIIYGKTVYKFLFTVVAHCYPGRESRLYIYVRARSLDGSGEKFFFMPSLVAINISK